MIKKKTNKKGAGGAPTKYKKEYCQDIIDFFNVPALKKNGKPNDPPYFIDFAMKIGVNPDTLAEWRMKHKEFSVAYAIAKRLQEKIISLNALHGRYNGGFAVRMLTNVAGWRTGEHIEANNTPMPPLKVEIVKTDATKSK